MSDILIVGAGPAGIAAAVTAASCGVQVTVIDDNPEPGGQIWRGGHPRVRWFDRLMRSGARIVTGARIVSADPPQKALLVERTDASFAISYQKLILATGARELFLPFPGWTSPDVVGVGGLQALSKSGLSVEGRRVILAGSGPFLLAAAAHLRKRGAIIPLIAEQAQCSRLARFARQLVRNPGKLLQSTALKTRIFATRYLPSCWVEKMSEKVATLRRGSRVWQEECDYLATGYGFRPNVELGVVLGCALCGDSIRVNELQETATRDIYAAGECTGVGGVDLAVIEGQIAGFAAAGWSNVPSKLLAARLRARQFAKVLNETFELRGELRSLVHDDTILCRCEDVRWGMVKDCRSRREAKLYTRFGMGPCQGRICGPMLDFLKFPDRDATRTPIFPARLETLVTEEEMTRK
jgi:D-hydroxyproline dehydrogenase subunit alpha